MDASLFIHLLIQVLVIGGICALLWWLIGFIGLPEPFNKVAKIIVAVVAVLFLINVLLTLGGTPLIRWR